MKRILKLLLVVIVAFLITTGCTKKEETVTSKEKEVKIIIYDKNKEVIYDETVLTNKELLIDVLKEQDEIDLKTENGQYGEYILSINDIEQGDNYYWTYYVNEEYASVGVSQYKIKNNEKYEFKIEEM
ncbi:MAG: DUF4430 domain-containing protein [Bacilli bacterium]|nr:DUF4430 domain-containing protein [Bacilli bacterium]